jgi:SAM-dependent methyltransferase
MRQISTEADETAKTFDAYGRKYAESVEEAISVTGLSLDFVTKVKADYIIDLSTAHFGSLSKLSVLDVGCGIGNFHRLLKPPFSAITGVDISRVSIDVAKEQNPDIDYQLYDGHRLPYQNDGFDIVFTVCVMHHVPPSQWPGFTAEMFRVLKPGGLALVFEHNPANPLTRRIVDRCPFDADAVLLQRSQTIDLFREAGFHTVRARSILSIPPAGKLLRQVDQLFGRLPFGAQYYVAAAKE